MDLHTLGRNNAQNTHNYCDSVLRQIRLYPKCKRNLFPFVWGGMRKLYQTHSFTHSFQFLITKHEKPTHTASGQGVYSLAQKLCGSALTSKTISAMPPNNSVYVIQLSHLDDVWLLYRRSKILSRPTIKSRVFIKNGLLSNIFTCCNKPHKIIAI